MEFKSDHDNNVKLILSFLADYECDFQIFSSRLVRQMLHQMKKERKGISGSQFQS